MTGGAAAGTGTAAGSGRTALLVGATGLVGSHCLRLLSADSFYARVVILVRRAATEPLSPKVEQHVVDFDRLEMLPPSLRADHVFCALGTTIRQAGSQQAFRKVDFEYPLVLAKLMLERGTEQFLVISSLGADRKARMFYSRVKGELEQELLILPFRGITIFRPSLLLGDRKEFRLGEEVAKRLDFLMPLRYKPIDASRVAAAMIAAAKENRAGTRIIESAEIQNLSVAA